MDIPLEEWCGIYNCNCKQVGNNKIYQSDPITLRHDNTTTYWIFLFEHPSKVLSVAECDAICITGFSDWIDRMANPTEYLLSLHKMLWEV